MPADAATSAWGIVTRCTAGFLFMEQRKHFKPYHA